jgi:hypothetical protein
VAGPEILEVVRALAARQDGVVTTSQLVAAGAHRSWVSDRVLSGSGSASIGASSSCTPGRSRGGHVREPPCSTQDATRH